MNESMRAWLWMGVLVLSACEAGSAGTPIGLTCAALDAEERADGSIVLEDDLRFASAEDAYAFLEARITDEDSSDVGAARAPLIASTDGPELALIPVALRGDVTYCVSAELGDARDAVLRGMERATAMWSEVADVRFRRVDPAVCEERGQDAHVVVIPGCSAGGVVAEAMLPWRSGRRGQDLTVNTCHRSFGAYAASDDAMARILLHELGHVLGFVHAWNTADYVGPCRCASETEFLDLAGYDARSIMNYPDCGAPWTLFDPPLLTEADREGARALYCAPGQGPPPCADE